MRKNNKSEQGQRDKQNEQTNKQTNKQTKQTNKKTNKKTNKQTKQTNKQATNKQTSSKATFPPSLFFPFGETFQIGKGHTGLLLCLFAHQIHTHTHTHALGCTEVGRNAGTPGARGCESEGIAVLQLRDWQGAAMPQQ